MAEIIWKNKSSKEIEGLIITETPPITKPKMKVNKIEIDGRDGDIIEKVGYESYTKNIGIGLTRSFNIDEVIKYFTGDGELIISDEPNKVYIASIYEDVDYEKLLTMKKATIKYHVQPYKYLKNEAKAELSVSTQKSIEVTNKGLEISKPIINLEGSGTIEIAVNNINRFVKDIGAFGGYMINEENPTDADVKELDTSITKAGRGRGEERCEKDCSEEALPRLCTCQHGYE